MAYVGFNGYDFREYLLEDGKLEPGRVRELFQAMEEEKVTLSSQLKGFLNICDATEYHDKKMYQTLVSVGKEIFGAYLEKHRGEMAEAAGQPEEKNDSLDIVKELHQGNKKRSLAWAYNTPFPKVHKKDGGEADEEYLQAILLAYSALPLKDGMASYNVCPVAAALALALEEKELAIYAEELLDRWIASGADPRKRWVLYVAAIHGNADMPERLGQLVREWASEGSNTIAAEALRALALSLRPQALEIVDGISRKFSPARIKAAAWKALRTAAAWVGTTREGLLDKTVPDLGFDEKAQRCFDYGKRKFMATITANLEIEAFDEKGKKLKGLPAPGKQDDEAKAAAAYEEFRQLKKLLKTVAAFQKMRLEAALADGRAWSIKAWEELFVKNPVMRQFATSLIWGVYEGGELVSSFRYREDGSFCTENREEIHPLDEDEASPQEGKMVKLVHPVELSMASQNAWEKQFEDYEIIQPVEQLERWEYYMEGDEEGQQSLDRFKGRTVNDESLKKILKKLGWEYRIDDYEYGTCFKENEELSLGVEVTFTVDMDNYYMYENTTIGVVKFYKLENGGMPDEDEACLLGDVPERYFSEIIVQLKEMTGS